MIKIPIVIIKNEPIPHDSIRFSSCFNKHLMIFPLRCYLIPSNDSIINKFSDSRTFIVVGLWNHWNENMSSCNWTCNPNKKERSEKWHKQSQKSRLEFIFYLWVLISTRRGPLQANAKQIYSLFDRVIALAVGRISYTRKSS